MLTLNALKGVGPQTLKKLNAAGIFEPEDLISWYPRDYISCEPSVSISDIQEEKMVTVFGHFTRPPVTRKYGGQQVTTGTFTDGTGNLTVNWYHMPYIAASVTDKDLYLRGKAVRKGSRLFLYQPSILKEEQYQEQVNKLMPVYPLKTGLTNKLLCSLVEQCLEHAELIHEYLPAGFRKRYQLAEANYAMKEIHFPDSRHDMLLARKRLVFDEFFFFMLSVRELKEQKHTIPNTYVFDKMEAAERLLRILPYKLTSAQKRTMDEIFQDMHSPFVMSRLVQGDVGSGKTVIAVLAMLHAAENGYQSALMAPTEVLAVQHYEAVCDLIARCGLGFQAVLLTGSMTAKQKRMAYHRIESHEADLIIGTHALIQEHVVYDRLALVITDEQHRFGVRQRSVFTEKSDKPHVLVMSATPIPRTLALILYGDLDISVIDEMPANRIPIKNCVVNETYLSRAYAFLEKEIEKGHQAYVICAMVEESEQVEAENVLDYAEKLKNALSQNIRIGILHGKMKPKEKNRIMQEFADHQIDLLVSTTVVEVGVNVPNATVMMIENAERFGLSQLHQLRGRVGRGSAQSYCIFMDRSGQKSKNERLSVLEKSNDGFFIAAEDLRLRGPGDFYGVRQNGQIQFALADIYTDAAIMKLAKEAADEVYDKTADLSEEEEKVLYELLEQYRSRAEASDVPL